MEYINNLADLIDRRRTVIRCCTKDDIYELAEMVEVLYPGKRNSILAYKHLPGHGRYVDGLGVRLEKDAIGTPDLGHSNISYYREMGYTIVDCSELLKYANIDLGEINVDTCSVCDLLFGGVYGV